MIVAGTRAFGIAVIIAWSELNLGRSPLYGIALERHTLSEPQALESNRPC
jgi:hypothetical protein